MRDSSRIRTKSLRIDSSVSCSTMCVPVAPPAMPVAITGCPSAFSARAMLTPLPPAIVRCSTVRWRRPRRKLGTESDLSIAALSVTVMIIPSASSASASTRRRVAPLRARPSVADRDRDVAEKFARSRQAPKVPSQPRADAPPPRAPHRAGSPPVARCAPAMLREAVIRPPARPGANAAARSSTRPPCAPTPGSSSIAWGISSRARSGAAAAWPRPPRPRR